MKRLLFIFAFLFAFLFAKSQDSPPTDADFKALSSYSIKYHLIDSTIWIYKAYPGGNYGWTKLAGDLRHWWTKIDSVVGLDTSFVRVMNRDTVNFSIYKLKDDSLKLFKLKTDSVTLKGYFTNSKARFYRLLTNHDSLSKLDERKYQSLTDTLLWGLGLNQFWHTVKVDTADISIPSRQRIAKYYRLLTDTTRLKGTATIFDLRSYKVLDDSSKYYEKLVNKTLNVTTDGASDIKYPSAKAVKTYSDSKVADAINDGVTTIAPAENAVFDALALKKDLNDSTDADGYTRRDRFLTGLNTKIGGSGTAGYMSYFTAARTLGNSQIFDDGTNIGIAKTNPTSPAGFARTVYLYDASSSSYTVEGSGNKGEFGISSGGGYVSTYTNAPLRFATYNTEKMRLDASGNLMLNKTSNPLGLLDVNGTGYISGNLTANAFIKIGGTSAQYLLADGSVTTSAGSVYKGEVSGVTGVPIIGGSALIDGTGTTSWYYACSTISPNTYDYGNPNGNPISLSKGDQIYYNGTIWIKIPGAGSYTLPIGTDIALGGVISNGNVSINAGTGGMTVLTNANLTGDVTSSGNTTTIAAKAVTLAKMGDMATASLIYRKTAGDGVPEVNSLATLKTDLGLTGTNGGILGTEHYLAKFNGINAVENSQIFDNGTSVGINTIIPHASAKLQVKVGVDQNFAIQGINSMADGITLNSYNDAVTANKSMELRASSFMFSVGSVGVKGIPEANFEVYGDGMSSATGIRSTLSSDVNYKVNLYVANSGHAHLINAGEGANIYIDPVVNLIISNGTTIMPVLKVTTGAGLNKVLLSDAVGLLSYSASALNTGAYATIANYRRNNDPDSLSTLQEKNYSSLDGKPTLGTASAQDVGYFSTAAQANANHSGDATGATALTLATVNANVGTYNNITINGKGLATAGSNVAYEPTLGNPGTNGYVLSSTTAGVRSWVIPQSGAQGIQGEAGTNGTNGTNGADGATGEAGPNNITTSTATNGTGFLKGNGSVISFDNSTYVTGTPWTSEGYLTSVPDNYLRNDASDETTGTLTANYFIGHNFTLTTSDSTLKRNIKPFVLSDYLKASKIDFKKYMLKADKTDRQHYGAMAQEVEIQFPEMVYTNPETGKKTVSYEELLIVKFAAMEERIRLLEEEIKLLKNEK